MGLLTLMCGLPGSGKSTMIKKYLEGNTRMVQVVSADHYFEDLGRFDQTKLGEAHGACFRATIVRLDESSPDEVIVDNTGLTNIERAPYVLAAQAFGWEVRMVDLVRAMDLSGLPTAVSLRIYADRNTHGVPLATIKHMNERYEQPPPFWPLKVVRAL